MDRGAHIAIVQWSHRVRYTQLQQAAAAVKLKTTNYSNLRDLKTTLPTM